MDEAEAFAQVRDLRYKWAEVSTIKEKWKANHTCCVAPKDVRIPLHMLAVAVQQARTLEEAQHFAGKIEAILEWVWPKNTPQRFQVFEHGDVRVEVPERSTENV